MLTCLFVFYNYLLSPERRIHNFISNDLNIYRIDASIYPQKHSICIRELLAITAQLKSINLDYAVENGSVFYVVKDHL